MCPNHSCYALEWGLSIGSKPGSRAKLRFPSRLYQCGRYSSGLPSLRW